MNSFTIKEIPPLTPEQIAELDALKYREIDYSDIPPLTDEELARMKANRARRLKMEHANQHLKADNNAKEIPPLTEEDLKCLELLSKMTDDDIDYSDIPPTSPEQLARMCENRRKRLERAQMLKQAV